MFQSSKFSHGRTRIPISDFKRSITFNKFIKHANKKIRGDPNYDIVAAFEHYDINCDYCLKEYGKVIELYIMQTDEIKRTIKNYVPNDLMVKCPNCYQVKRVSDIRRLTSAGTIPAVGEENYIGHIGSSTGDRDISPVEALDPEVRGEYYRLLNMSKNYNGNKKVGKELENYVKEYASQMKLVKPALMSDIQTLIASGKMITKIEDNNF